MKSSERITSHKFYIKVDNWKLYKYIFVIKDKKALLYKCYNKINILNLLTVSYFHADTDFYVIIFHCIHCVHNLHLHTYARIHT